MPSDGVAWVQERINEEFGIEVDVPNTLFTIFDSETGLYTFEGTAEWTVGPVTIKKDFVVVYDSKDCSVKINGLDDPLG